MGVRIVFHAASEIGPDRKDVRLVLGNKKHRHYRIVFTKYYTRRPGVNPLDVRCNVSIINRVLSIRLDA